MAHEPNGAILIDICGKGEYLEPRMSSPVRTVHELDNQPPFLNTLRGSYLFPLPDRLDSLSKGLGTVP